MPPLPPSSLLLLSPEQNMPGKFTNASDCGSGGDGENGVIFQNRERGIEDIVAAFVS